MCTNFQNQERCSLFWKPTSLFAQKVNSLVVMENVSKKSSSAMTSQTARTSLMKTLVVSIQELQNNQPFLQHIGERDKQLLTFKGAEVRIIEHNHKNSYLQQDTLYFREYDSVSLRNAQKKVWNIKCVVNTSSIVVFYKYSIILTSTFFKWWVNVYPIINMQISTSCHFLYSSESRVIIRETKQNALNQGFIKSIRFSQSSTMPLPSHFTTTFQPLSSTPIWRARFLGLGVGEPLRERLYETLIQTHSVKISTALIRWNIDWVKVFNYLLKLINFKLNPINP